MIVTFLGTKGGTGTTTMAVNCAAAIHRLHRRHVLVVDAKQGPGDVAVFLGLRPRYSLLEFIDQVGWSSHALASRFVTEHRDGLHAVAASDRFGRPDARDVEGFERVLHCVASMYDVVVVDAGSMLTSTALAALTASDDVMLVANPDVPCLRNLQRLTDALRLGGVTPERVRIVLNRAHGSALPLAQIERALGRTIDFQVPSDYRTVAAALNSGQPIASPRPTDLQLQIESIARTLVGVTRAAAAS